jgi:hypothetical protein
MPQNESFRIVFLAQATLDTSERQVALTESRHGQRTRRAILETDSYLKREHARSVELVLSTALFVVSDTNL